jgi:hypothetical protein
MAESGRRILSSWERNDPNFSSICSLKGYDDKRELEGREAERGSVSRDERERLNVNGKPARKKLQASAGG